jgi:hypothetical protein
MVVPTVFADLHTVQQERVAHAPLDKAPGQQTLAPKAGCLRIVETVKGLGLVRFAGEINEFRCSSLHAESKFVGADASLEFTGLATVAQMPAEQKNRISHRALALASIADKLRSDF